MIFEEKASNQVLKKKLLSSLKGNLEESMVRRRTHDFRIAL